MFLNLSNKSYLKDRVTSYSEKAKHSTLEVAVCMRCIYDVMK